MRQGGGGDPVSDQAPKTCRPITARWVVAGGLMARPQETASLFPWGGW